MNQGFIGHQLSIRYVSQSEQLFESIDIHCLPGQVVTVMGPSGCGKSSLLAYISGFLAPVFRGEGECHLNGKALNGIAAEDRHIGQLFQDDLLFPHMTVLENICFALPAAHRHHRKKQALEWLERIDLKHLSERFPSQLSGGQRSRISLIRTLASEPSMLLLDEPFAKLDINLRQSFRQLVFDLIEIRQVPALLVTHDIADAPPGGPLITLRIQQEKHHAG